MAGSMSEVLELSGGIKMPTLGLGTWQADGEQLRQAIEVALDCGYKMIDTAYMYDNESIIGDVLHKRLTNGQLMREDIFITTKLHFNFTGSRQTIRRCFEKSLANLKLDYVDLYLVHCPMGFKAREDEGLLIPTDEDGNPQMESHDHVQVWKELEALVDEGKIKAIGVSNFNSKQIARILSEARHPIATNQVECHAYLQQDQLLDFCMERGIYLTAYAPIGSPGTKSSGDELLNDPVVKQIADKHKKTVPQVLLRWLIQRGFAVIPKSANPDRIRENRQVFDFVLDAHDMELLKKLNKNRREFKWLAMTGGESHPDYPFTEPF